MLDNPWPPGIYHNQQQQYQTVVECKLWPVLGSFDDCKIVNVDNKTTSSEDFDDVHKVVIYGISTNMESLVQTDKYCATSAEDPTIIGYLFIKYILDNFTLQ